MGNLMINQLCVHYFSKLPQYYFLHNILVSQYTVYSVFDIRSNQYNFGAIELNIMTENIQLQSLSKKLNSKFLLHPCNFTLCNIILCKLICFHLHFLEAFINYHLLLWGKLHLVHLKKWQPPLEEEPPRFLL